MDALNMFTGEMPSCGYHSFTFIYILLRGISMVLDPICNANSESAFQAQQYSVARFTHFVLVLRQNMNESLLT